MPESPLVPEWVALGIPVNEDAEPEDADAHEEDHEDV